MTRAVSFTAGTHSLTAKYSGNSSDKPVTSAALSVSATQRQTSTSLSISPSPTIQGQVVALSATVTNTTAGPYVFTFKEGATVLGTASGWTTLRLQHVFTTVGTRERTSRSTASISQTAPTGSLTTAI